MAEEGLRKTENDMIHIGCPIAFDADEFFAQLGPLMHDAYHNRRDICATVAELVPTYHPAEQPAAEKIETAPEPVGA